MQSKRQISDYPENSTYSGLRDAMRIYGTDVRADPADSPVWSARDTYWHHTLTMPPTRPALPEPTIQRVFDRVRSLSPPSTGRWRAEALGVAVRGNIIDFLMAGDWPERKRFKRRFKSSLA
ncbi:MAG: hypothetical protein AAFQ82_25280, partial [Myxococcota bacterium]